jgi:hypothetical protein
MLILRYCNKRKTEAQQKQHWNTVLNITHATVQLNFNGHACSPVG